MKNYRKFTTPVQSRIKDVDELRERIKAAWEELDQCIIDTAVTQWSLAFMHVSRQKATTLSTSCLD